MRSRVTQGVLVICGVLAATSALGRDTLWRGDRTRGSVVRGAVPAIMKETAR